MDSVWFYTYGCRDLFWETIGNFGSRVGLMQRRPPPTTRLDGQTIIVTGGNKNIGKEVSMDLAARGARVIIACRDMDSAAAVVEEIRKTGAGADPVVKPVDMSSLQSIRQFADDIIASEERIDCLVNNAGVMQFNRRETVDGLEMNMAVDYFGPVYLTMLLLDKMRSTSDDPRVVSVASMAHGNINKIDIDDLNFKKSFDLMRAYGTAKLGVIMFSRELARRQGQVRVYAVDPGFSPTNLFDHLPWFLKMFINNPLASLHTRPVREAAGSIIHAVLDSREEYDPANNYLYDGNVKDPHSVALVRSDSQKLWDETSRILNLKSMQDL